MSAITLFDLNGEQRFTGTSVGTSLAFSLTSDPNTYALSWEHDFAQISMVLLRTTITALHGDGEVWGPSAGQIALNPGAFEARRESGGFPIEWLALTTSLFTDSTPNVNDAFDTVGDFQIRECVTPQCLRYSADWIILADGGAGGIPYAGPNHPTVTVTLDAIYR